MQARLGDPLQGDAVSVGLIWYACIAIHPVNIDPRHFAAQKCIHLKENFIDNKLHSYLNFAKCITF